MFGLGKQIHRDPIRIGFAIADDEDFGWPRNHVDADHAKHAALGGCDIGIARADDFVHLRYGRGAVSQRAHGLRTADGEYAIHATHMRRGQY